jgi:hypothetical protein
MISDSGADAAHTDACESDFGFVICPIMRKPCWGCDRLPQAVLRNLAYQPLPLVSSRCERSQSDMLGFFLTRHTRPERRQLQCRACQETRSENSSP